MAYTTVDYPTKKALKEALKAGKEITIYQPGGLFPCPKNGAVALEGPHFPKPHKWYAEAKLQDGLVISVK